MRGTPAPIKGAVPYLTLCFGSSLVFAARSVVSWDASTMGRLVEVQWQIQPFERLRANYLANDERPNQTLQPTGHANEGSSRHGGFSRVSRLLSWGRSAVEFT